VRFQRLGIELLSCPTPQTASIRRFTAVERAADVVMLAPEEPRGQTQLAAENPFVNILLILLVRKRLKYIQ
jgi:hypothetical protein